MLARKMNFGPSVNEWKPLVKNPSWIFYNLSLFGDKSTTEIVYKLLKFRLTIYLPT